MIKNLFKLVIIGGFIIGGFFITSSPTYAANCARPISGNFTVTTDCVFGNLVDGVDTGTGSTNTAVLTVQSGILTVNSNQVIAVGSISMTGGSIAANGPLKTKMPLWLVDADADGYPTNTTQYAQTGAPTNGRRRNVMTSITTVDCSDSNYSTTNCCPIAGNYFGDGSDGNVTISSNTNIANTADGDYVVKKYNTLTINSGITLTTQNRAKGMLIYVKGNAIINGVLSMTAKGASANPVTAGVSATGLRLPLLKSGSTSTLSAADFAGAGSAVITAVANQEAISGNGKIYVIPRTGANGAAGGTVMGHGTVGSSGTGGRTGGGGEGANNHSTNCTSGGGGNGTAFSGGPGGGSACGGAGTNIASGGSDTGGAGGYGAAYYCSAGGGAGNSGGAAACYGCDGGQGEYANPGEAGTGGVIWLIVGGNLTIGSGGKIEANGKNGGDGYRERDGGGAGGGASGGGSVFVLYAGTLSNSGTVEASGGTGGDGVGWGTNGFGYDGGNGGTGYTVIEQVGDEGISCP